MEYWETVFEEIRRQLAAEDRCMAQEHARRADLAKMDVRYLFGAGDEVFLRSRELGKLKCRATGPYVFRRYVGWRRTNAEIKGDEEALVDGFCGQLAPSSSLIAHPVSAAVPRGVGGCCIKHFWELHLGTTQCPPSGIGVACCKQLGPRGRRGRGRSGVGFGYRGLS